MNDEGFARYRGAATAGEADDDGGAVLSFPRRRRTRRRGARRRRAARTARFVVALAALAAFAFALARKVSDAAAVVPAAAAGFCAPPPVVLGRRRRSFRPPVRRRRGARRPLPPEATRILEDDDDDSSSESSTSDRREPSRRRRGRCCRRRRRRYLATCVPGLERVLSNELMELGADDVVPSGNSGVKFASSLNDDDDGTDDDTGLKAILWLRTAHRVMELICSTDDPDPDSCDDDHEEEPNGDDDRDAGDRLLDFCDSSSSSEPIRSKDDLYSYLRSPSVPIKDLLGNGNGGLLTLSVRVVLNGVVPKELCHTHYTALTVKNALVDSVRDLRRDGRRPDVDVRDPDVPLVCVLRGRDGRTADCSLYRCLHAGSLHRRGYRLNYGSGSGSGSDGARREPRGGTRGGGKGSQSGKIHKAALKESLASGLLLSSGWRLLCDAARSDGLPAILVDPMAGSGTIPIEASTIACDVAPGLMRIKADPSDGRHRRPPAVRWKRSDAENWKELLKDATGRAKEGAAWAKSVNEAYPRMTNVVVLANERNSRSALLARSNLSNAGLTRIVRLTEGDCRGWDLGGRGGSNNHDDDDENDGERERERDVLEGRTIIATNPPWGTRLSDDVEDSWDALREFLRRECVGTEAWVLSGNRNLTRILKMKKSRSVPLRTGGEDLRWMQYRVFAKRGEPTTTSKTRKEEEKREKENIMYRERGDAKRTEEESTVEA